MDQVDITLSDFAKNSARYALKRRIRRRGQTTLILVSPRRNQALVTRVHPQSGFSVGTSRTDARTHSLTHTLGSSINHQAAQEVQKAG
jgi:hypothetical protein